MKNDAQEDARARAKQRHEVSRSAQFFGLLIAAIAVLNGLIYWERGSVLFLVACLICVVALIGWWWYARRVLRSL